MMFTLDFMWWWDVEFVLLFEVELFGVEVWLVEIWWVELVVLGCYYFVVCDDGGVFVGYVGVFVNGVDVDVMMIVVLFVV